MVHLVSSLSLAALELLAHIDYERALSEFSAVSVDFDETLLLSVDAASLPEHWGEDLTYIQALGNAWVERKASALLAVPSRVVPVERTQLLAQPGALGRGSNSTGRTATVSLRPARAQTLGRARAFTCNMDAGWRRNGR